MRNVIFIGKLVLIVKSILQYLSGLSSISEALL